MMTTALLDRLTRHRHLVETCDKASGICRSSDFASKRNMGREQEVAERAVSQVTV